MDSETTSNGNVQSLTAEEHEVYDRQIQLWGISGQLKLKSTKVLIVGMQGLGAEIAKNIILAGVKSVTLQDWTDVSTLDRSSQFLISPDSTEPNRAKASLVAAQELNPNVTVIASTVNIADQVDSYVNSFDVIFATDCSPELYKKLSNECRKLKKMLFIGDVYGLFGYFYQDLKFKDSIFLHEQIFPLKDEIVLPDRMSQPLCFILTSALLLFYNNFNRKPQNEEDIEQLKSIIDSSINHDSIKSDMFDGYYSELFCELSPTTSIVGGVMVQTAIQTMVTNNAREYNVFFYNNLNSEGIFHLIPPQP